ncbi:MAG: TonB-dependent receptor domain-containing protein [Candidatus Competibacterales bacterium]
MGRPALARALGVALGLGAGLCQASDPWLPRPFEPWRDISLGPAVTAAPADPTRAATSVALALADRSRWADAALALEALEGQVVGKAGDPHVAWGLAWVALWRGETAAAARALERALALGLPTAGERASLVRIALALERGQRQTARQLALDALREPLTQPAPYLWLFELDRRRDPHRALMWLTRGAERFPHSPHIAARRGSFLAARGEVATAREAIERAMALDPASPEPWLARGDLARRLGQSQAARAAYVRATRLRPEDDRPWFSLGALDVRADERAQALDNWRRAVALNPGAGDYRGALGLFLTTLRRFGDAERYLHEGRTVDPNAAGLRAAWAYWWLRRGDASAALEALAPTGGDDVRPTPLEALMAGVAHYRLGDRERGRQLLAQAALDAPEEPLPGLLRALAAQEVFEAFAAAARAHEAAAALERRWSFPTPVTDATGSASTGHALALLGLETWAKIRALGAERSQPGDAWLLASLLADPFNAASQRLLGGLQAPTAVGVPLGFSPLLPADDLGIQGGVRVDDDGDTGLIAPFATVRGLGFGGDFAYRLGLDGAGLGSRGRGGSGAAGGASVALGAILGAQWHLYAGAHWRHLDTDSGRDRPARQGSSHRLDFAGDYRLSATTRWRAKTSRHQEIRQTLGEAGGEDYQSVTVNDLAVAQVVQPIEGFQWEVGAGYARRVERETAFDGDAATDDSSINRRLRDDAIDLYTGLAFEALENLWFEGQMRFDHVRQQGEAEIRECEACDVQDDQRDRLTTRLSPSFGTALRVTDALAVRAAFQTGVGPAASSTLAAVDTVGIPMERSLVESGGEVVRLRGQGEWILGERALVMAFVDRLWVDNRVLLEDARLDGTDRFVALNELLDRLRFDPDLGKLHPRLRTGDLRLEGDPNFDSGDVLRTGLAVNAMVDQRLALLARYDYTDSDLDDSGAGERQLPFMAQHVAVLGARWISPARIDWGAEAVYRSERFEDAANRQVLEAGWDLTLRGGWTSRERHIAVRAQIDQLLHPDRNTRYGLWLEYRN